MRTIKVIYTELGQIPVIITPVKENSEEYYNGIILGENSIFIQAKSIAKCLEQLKKAFELSMHFWVRFELSDIGLTYEGKVKKDWYNK
jgi:hypothetical protein